MNVPERYAKSKMHKKLQKRPLWNKKLVERGIPHIPNRARAMQKAWITAPHQKRPKKMPSACPACCRSPLQRVQGIGWVDAVPSKYDIVKCDGGLEAQLACWQRQRTAYTSGCLSYTKVACCFQSCCGIGMHGFCLLICMPSKDVCHHCVGALVIQAKCNFVSKLSCIGFIRPIGSSGATRLSTLGYQTYPTTCSIRLQQRIRKTVSCT